MVSGYNIKTPDKIEQNSTFYVDLIDTPWPMFHHDQQHSGYSTSDAPSTNNTLWKYQTGDFVCSSPAIADNRIYIGSVDNKLYCLNATTGSHIWSYNTTGGILSSPSVNNSKIYVGSYDSMMYCLIEN